MDTRKRNNRIAGKALAVLLAICMVGCSFIFAEPVSAGVFSTTSVLNGGTYTHAARYDGKMIVNGVDVSYWQSKSSDWEKAKANGVDYAIMRVSYTSYRPKKLSTNIDSKFQKHFESAGKAGVMRGVYVFSQAKSAAEAKAEATFAVNRLKALGIKPADLALPVYMDYEFAGSSSGLNKGRLYGLKKDDATAAAKAFCDTIRAAGYKAGIYANTTFFKNYINTSKLGSNVDLWCAQYNYRNTSTVNYSKWQYSSKAKIGGILNLAGLTGSTDVNFWYIDKKGTSSFVTEVYGVTDYNYTGEAITPILEVYSGKKLLKEGRDYKIEGITNVNPGSNSACAYIRGIGSYSGYALVTFSIGSGYISRPGLKNFVSGSSFTFKTSSGSLGMNSYGSYIRNIPAGKTVKDFLAGVAFKSGKGSGYSFAVINSEGNRYSDSSKVETGMLLGIYDKSGKLAGTADLTVKGSSILDNGSQYGIKKTSSATFAAAASAASGKVTVSKTTIKRLTSKKKGFTVKVAKKSKSKVSGYQVRYSRNKSMSGAVVRNISSKYNKTSKTISKLKSKKRYYVQVRSYKIVNGKKYYSGWSSKKSVKTK